MLQATLSSRITAGLLCILLAACGGGGGDPAAPQAGAADTGTGSTGSSPAPSSPVPAASGSSAPLPASGASGNAGSPAGNEARPAPNATDARFNRPIGIAVDSAGNLYVADSQNNTIRKIALSGHVATLAGSPGMSGSADGTGAAARFSFLKGIAVDASGTVYAVDNNAIRKITAAGAVTTLAGVSGELGDADGSGSAARFRHPWGIAADASGNVYVADTDNYLVRKITPAGTVSTHAGTRGMRGTADGSTATATFLGPMGIAIDRAGNLSLTDWYGPPAPNIPETSTFIRRIAANGSVSTIAGNFASEKGPAAFSDAFAIAADDAGNVYVAALRSVRKVTPSGTISTIVESAQFQSLLGATIDANGTLFVTDESNHTVSRVTQAGTVTLIAGKPGESGAVDVVP